MRLDLGRNGSTLASPNTSFVGVRFDFRLDGGNWPILLKKELNFALKSRTNLREKCLTFIGE